MIAGTIGPLAPLVLATLAQAAPLVIAALGGILSERSGIINIALEGEMLTGAFVGMWVGQTHGPAVGLLAALLAGALIGAGHFVFTQKLKVDHIISGVAIDLLAVNLTTYLVRGVFNAEGRVAKVDYPLPVGAFVLAAALLVVAVHFLLYRTRFGLRLRSVGEAPESARMAGLAPLRLRFAASLLSGILAGGAGAYLSLSLTTRFSDNMTNGRGYIALAAVVCGRWTPFGAALAALAFGFFDALQIQLQGRVAVPSEFLQMLPYVTTILAAMLLRPVPPAALGKDEG